MKNPLGGGNGMVAHYSGTTLDAQARYAAGAKDILSRWLEGKEQDPQNLIVIDGDYATKACEYLLKFVFNNNESLLSYFRRSTRQINEQIFIWVCCTIIPVMYSPLDNN